MDNGGLTPDTYIAEMDIVEVLDWTTASWRGLIDSSAGMFYPAPVQDMILKTDTILGIAAGKNLDPLTMLTIKRNLAFLLAEYGYQMKDVSALQNSIRLARDVISVNPVDPETKLPVGDMEIESILGQSLFTLGNLQANTENLDEAAMAYQNALKFVERKSDPAYWADLQTGLGAALAQAGDEQADPAKINQAIEAFSGAEQETDPVAQPHQWMFVQTGLGASFQFLGAREVGTVNLKKAVSHFLAAQTKDAKVLFPDDYATAETNIGGVYYSLGQRERSADDMKQSILHSTQAADQFRAMGNNYGLGFALAHLGQAQLRLAHYTEDDTLLDQCQENLKQSELFIPEAQDANMWGENQLYLGIALGSKGDKTSNIQMMKDASTLFEGLKTLYDPKIRRPMWNEINSFQAANELTLGKLSCDTTNEEGVIAQLNQVNKGMDPVNGGLMSAQVDDVLVGAMELKAVKDGNLKLMLKAYRLLKDVVSRTESGNDPVLLVLYRSDMAVLYANLLSQNPEPRLIAEAAAFLDIFEKAGLTSPVPADEAAHEGNAAKLERVLAEVNKDPARLTQARIYATNALKLFQTYHYSFREASCDMELGKMDMLLAKLAQDKTAGPRAVAEFTAAQKIYQTLGLCFEAEAKAKIAEASAL